MHAYELLQKGGAWLGAARSWVQRKKRNGESVTWGSSTPLEPPMTMGEVEEVAAEAAAAAFTERGERDRAVAHCEGLRAALKRILLRHDDGKCLCDGCCIARGALTGKRGDNIDVSWDL